MSNERLMKENIEAFKREKHRTISDLRIIDKTIKNKLKKSIQTRKYKKIFCKGVSRGCFTWLGQ